MHDSIIATLDFYRRQANSCCGQDAYKKIDEIISVLGEEVPLVKIKKGIIMKPYDSSYDDEYTSQLRYLGKMIELKLIRLKGTKDS